MHPGKSTRAQQQFLLNSGLIQQEMISPFKKITDEMIELISDHFDNIETFYIHGDCHFSNILERPEEPLTLIDFDDMALGPPVQDLWMLLPDTPENSLVEIDLFIEGYQTFKAFERKTLALIEPLRAMRYVHYMAWCAYQALEDGNVQLIENFGSREYWVQEVADLDDLLKTISEDEGDQWYMGGNC